MLLYKCKSCGSEMEFGGTVTFTCPYCGSKNFLSDKDFKGNEKFRQMLLQYYKAEAENKEKDYSKDTLWVHNGTDSYVMTNGNSLNIEYMNKTAYDGAVCYLAKENIVYVFDKIEGAEAFLSGVNRLSYPPADTKLYRSFPELNIKIDLKNGARVLVFKRRPYFYPAEMFAPWPSEHLAWVISRMENICCALKYANLEHGNIEPSAIWINPVTHEGALFGDWRNIQNLKGVDDLRSIRKTAIALAKDTRKPIQMYDFLNSEPEHNAFADFEKWDKVIIDGFGGHAFIKM